MQFKATGSAPVMRQTKFKINAQQRFQAVIDFLRKQLKLDSSSNQEQLVIIKQVLRTFMLTVRCLVPVRQQFLRSDTR